MSCKILNFIKDNFNIDINNETKIMEKNIIDEDFTYHIKIKITKDYHYKFIKNTCNIKIYDDYDLLIENIEKKIKLIEYNDTLSLIYKINYFENGIWYFGIDIKKNKIINNTKDNSNDNDKEDLFVDMNTWDLKEWILDLLKENKELTDTIDELKKRKIN